ncbi:MAG: zinc ribbon domain-containing protein YjdM [Cardiobacteriaceae bacterium]|nr:zinc ribbon domain-containing protein YjdM [Cardiobacteriaceae bacterium]
MSLTCPQCQSPYAYYDGQLNICPECGHEWDDTAAPADAEEQVLDANGTPLQDGDSVVLIKALKPKGSSQSIKQGTKVKNIRVIPGADHNIDCKIDGFGGMMLKSEFVKKST